MKLEKLSALAEFVSSIAILVTLVYLAVQTQQTNTALNASSREATMMADVTMLAAAVEHPELNVNLEKEEVTELEYEQLEIFLAAFLRIREYAWYQYQSGILDEVTWRSYLSTAARLIGSPQGRKIWKTHSLEMNPEFVQEVNRLIQ